MSPSIQCAGLRRSTLALALIVLPLRDGGESTSFFSHIHASRTTSRVPRIRRTSRSEMKQFFDHYLMDKLEPKWMTDGVPQVKKGVE